MFSKSQRNWDRSLAQHKRKEDTSAQLDALRPGRLREGCMEVHTPEVEQRAEARSRHCCIYLEKEAGECAGHG